MVTHKRLQLLSDALKSIVENVDRVRKTPISSGLQVDFKIKVFVNGEDPESIQFLQSFHQSCIENFEFFEHKKLLTPAEARNHLLRNASGDWIVFLDDDIRLHETFFLSLIHLIHKNPSTVVWGGPNLTPPENDELQKEGGWILGEPLITGPISARYQVSHKALQNGGQSNLMLCNLVIKKSWLEGLNFKVIFKTAEENELLYRLSDKGAKMQSSPELYVFHERRKKRHQFLRQIYYYGYGRGQLFFQRSMTSQMEFLAFCLLYPLGLLSLISLPWMAIIPVGVGLYISAKYFYQKKKLSWFVFLAPLIISSVYFYGIVTAVVQNWKFRK